MEFNFNEDQLEIRSMVRDFCRNVVSPQARELDESKDYPYDLVKELSELGLMGMTIPEQYGGIELDTISYCLATEEIAKASPALSMTIGAQNSLSAGPILLFGTDEQKSKYLPRLASGEALGAFGFTEPNAGSDAAGMRTSAEKKGSKFILNGTKIFITNGSVADILIVFAKTDKDKGHRGISAFIVEKGFPGFSIGKVEEKMGMYSSPTSELVFEDCEVPEENLLGELDSGFKIGMATLNSGRIGVGVQALGCAQGAYELAINYSKERSQFGASISKFQGIQWMLADMHTKLQAARLMLYNAAWKKDNGEPYSLESASAKLFATEASTDICHKALQIHGGYGYCKEYMVEQYYRAVRLFEIVEGTSEIQRLIIAKEILK